MKVKDLKKLLDEFDQEKEIFIKLYKVLRLPVVFG